MMSSLTQQLFVAPVWTALFISALVILFAGWFDSLTGQHWQRRQLGKRLAKKRIGRMLGHLNIDKDRYLKTNSVPELRRQLANCRHCAHKQSCDAQLAQPAEQVAIEFCPNISAIKQGLLQRQWARESGSLRLS